MRKKNLIIIAVVLIFLIATNPSLKDFQDFLGSTKSITKRATNYFIFSIYSASSVTTEDNFGDSHQEGIDGKYVGIIGNFFEIDKKPLPILSVDSAAVRIDTTAVIIDSSR